MNLTSFPKSQQQEIIEALDEFGLDGKEREVYFTLLKFSSMTLSPLAKILKFPPTTLQSILIRLEKKGLLNVTMHRSRHVYVAQDPTIFKKILERRLQDITNIMPLLKELKSEEPGQSKIKIYYRDRVADIFHEALKAKSKYVYEIVSAKDFQDIIGEKFHFTKRRVQEGVRLKSLRVEKWEIKKYNKKIHEKELREAKFLPYELTFRTSIMLWDNTMAFFTTKQEGLAWTVESATLAEMFKQFFDLLWSVSRKMETLEEIKM